MGIEQAPTEKGKQAARGLRKATAAEIGRMAVVSALTDSVP